MTQGVLIYAHNSRDLDYAKLALVAGTLAKKNLKRSVSLITDTSTIAWMKESETYDVSKDVFEHIVITEKPDQNNKRNLHDGYDKKVIPFLNANRSSAYELTPYDQTLLIDSDFLVFSDTLNNYWNNDPIPIISSAFKDACDVDRRGYHDRYTSDTGVKLYWATTLMFNKTAEAKAMFDLVAYIKQNYQYYSDLFRFHPGVYRNDIAFSIARHIIYGFQSEETEELPPVLSCIDKDILHSVDQDGKLKVLFSVNNESNYVLGSFAGVDLHIMNKQSIIRNYKTLVNIE